MYENNSPLGPVYTYCLRVRHRLRQKFIIVSMSDRENEYGTHSDCRHTHNVNFTETVMDTDGDGTCKQTFTVLFSSVTINLSDSKSYVFHLLPEIIFELKMNKKQLERMAKKAEKEEKKNKPMFAR